MLATTFDNQYNDWEQQEHRNSNLPNVTEIARWRDDVAGSTYYIGELSSFGFNYDESQYTPVNAIQTATSDSYEDQRDNMSGIPYLDRSRKGNIWYDETGDPDFGTVQAIAREKEFSFVFQDGPGRPLSNSRYSWNAELTIYGMNQSTSR